MTLNIDPRIIRFDDSHILYDSSLLEKPFRELFDPDWFAVHGLLVGRARGRGTSFFLRYERQQWVLRHYRRGGWAARLLNDQFIGWDLNRSRSWVEWRLLAFLYAKGFPVPRPVAAGVRKSYGYYRCDLITQKIVNTRTLADLLQHDPLPLIVWGDIGACLRRFHEAGVYHPDLNANNILLDDKRKVYLIDFDRGRLRRDGPWRQDNIRRLERSLYKIAGNSAAFYFEEAYWRSFLDGYGRDRPETLCE